MMISWDGDQSWFCVMPAALAFHGNGLHLIQQCVQASCHWSHLQMWLQFEVTTLEIKCGKTRSGISFVYEWKWVAHSCRNEESPAAPHRVIRLALWMSAMACLFSLFYHFKKPLGDETCSIITVISILIGHQNRPSYKVANCNIYALIRSQVIAKTNVVLGH